MKKSKITECKACGTPIAGNAKVCPSCGAKIKKPFYKNGWFIIIAVIVVLVLIGSIKKSVQNASAQKVKYTWPENALTSQLPRPESEYGKINSEREDYFAIDIYKVSEEDFNHYIDSCKESGFTVDYQRLDDHYSADNDDGYSLTLGYDAEEKIMDISIDAPLELNPDEDMEEARNTNTSEDEERQGADAADEADAESDQGDESDDQNNEAAESADDAQNEEEAEDGSGEEDAQQSSDGVTPEFKQFMDEYEEFMNRYVDFLNTYNSDPGNAVAMLDDYTKIMSEYADYVQAVEKYDKEQMTPADAAYYVEVTARVSKKLLEIQY